MPTPQTSRGLSITPARSATPHKAGAHAKDAITLLKADHEALGHLFAEYGKTHSVSNKKALVAEICAVLSVHAQIAEEIFYPEVNDALGDTLKVPEGTVGHAAARHLIAQVEGAEPDGKLYDAKVIALWACVRRHVKEEHSEIFPRARATTVDMAELGARMAARRRDLLARRA